MVSENVVTFPGSRSEGPPYLAWLARRFPDGLIGYDPPVEVFLDSPETGNAWTSYVPEGGVPTRLRMSLYLRRDWRGEAGTLCLGNAQPAGDEAPRTWDEAVLGLLREAVADLAARAAAAGIRRIVVQDVAPEARGIYLGLGYYGVGEWMERDLA